MAVTRSGHSYSDIHISDASRNHLGDNYYQYGPSPEQQAFRAVLDSLRYDGMDDRVDRLNSAERGTFEWALGGRDVRSRVKRYGTRDDGDREEKEQTEDEEVEDSTDDYDIWHKTRTIDDAFANWLMSEEEEGNLFCFMGKPGSGKSTLMKYLSTNPKVEQFLETWTADDGLIFCQHFFWIMGGTVQKSREGLLRHLLYSALLSLPTDNLDLAKHICGSKRLSSHSQRAWSYEELYDMLVRLVSRSKAKFFFLVDALDECDPQDLHGQLANEMMKISQLPNVKLCVSCRPWSPFVSKFRHDRTLRLDEMTYEDMNLYICNRLANADGENDLCSEFRFAPRTERITGFVVDLVHAAEGVFLWTELVIKALSSELRKGCDFEQLQKARTEFPVGLDEYFQQLVYDRITKTRQNTFDTAAALMLALKIEEFDEEDAPPFPNSFFNFWLLRTGQLTAGFSWENYDETRHAREGLEQMVSLTTKFIHETCKDLLVVVERPYPSWHPSWLAGFWGVEFLHRTVADFLYDDRVRLAIKQQSPDHFDDGDFLIDLGKMRVVGLLSVGWKNCEDAEHTFARALAKVAIACPRWGQPSDSAWASRCETLMIDVHQRMQKAGTCRRIHHNTTWVYAYTHLGLSEYLSALIVLWPRLAISSGQGGPSFNVLERFLLGLLTIREDFHARIPTRTAKCGLRSSASPQGCVSSSSDGSICSQERSAAHSYYHLVCISGDRRIRLFNHLLSCGIDPNRQTLEQDLWQLLPDGVCRRSVWETWLRDLWLILHNHEAEKPKHPSGFDSVLYHVKNNVSDIVAVFLRHGADPTCSVCVSRHHDGEACKLVPLESVLASTTSQDTLIQLQALRAMHSTRGYWRISRTDHLLGAMRSWTASRRTAYSFNMHDDQKDSCMFLSGMVENIGGFMCDCSLQHEERRIEFTSAFCLDCTGGYYMCGTCAQKHYNNIPTRDDVSELLIHEYLHVPSNDSHTYIWFGLQAFGDGPWQYYGVERSMSVLEDWYATRTNGEDTVLD